MKLKKQFSSLLLVLCLFLTGCNKLLIPNNANAAFRNFTLDLFRQEVASNTINLHYSLQDPNKYGITGMPISLGSYDFHEVATLASIENLEAALNKFSRSSLSKENQLTYDILSDYFSKAKTDAHFYLYQEPLSPVTGIHAQLPVLLAEFQLQKKSDVDTYLALLETMPDYFSSLIRLEQQKADAGLFMSDNLVDEVVSQCNAFISMGQENYLLSTFEDRLSQMTELSKKELSYYLSKNQTALSDFVLPSYEYLATSLTALKGSEKNSQGLCALTEGKAYYKHLVSMDTGSGRTISQLKTLIKNQVSSDLLEVQKLLEELATTTEPTISLNQSPEGVLQNLEEKISAAFPKGADVTVQVKYVPSALEEYLSPAFYLIPAIDNYSQNTIYINQAYSLDQLDLFTTLAHEGYPGHLYQTTYFSNTNPDPIRTLLGPTGYVEGWATYAEMCSYSLAPLEKPYAALLQKNNSLILGLYASADMGIHYDGWSLNDTIDFFSSYGIEDKTTIEEIYKYIVGDPANYMVYYVGYLEMLELKKEMIAEKGASFSQKEFHKQILEIGPAPFEIIRKYLF